MKRRETTSRDIDEILSIALRGSEPKAGAPKFQATASRRQLVAYLRSYGEDLVAKRLPSLSDHQMQRIFTAAAEHTLTQNRYDRALCLGAIEIIEGRPRELTRKRRRNAT